MSLASGTYHAVSEEGRRYKPILVMVKRVPIMQCGVFRAYMGRYMGRYMGCVWGVYGGVYRVSRGINICTHV